MSSVSIEAGVETIDARLTELVSSLRSICETLDDIHQELQWANRNREEGAKRCPHCGSIVQPTAERLWFFHHVQACLERKIA